MPIHYPPISVTSFDSRCAVGLEKSKEETFEFGLNLESFCLCQGVGDSKLQSHQSLLEAQEKDPKKKSQKVDSALHVKKSPTHSLTLIVMDGLIQMGCERKTVTDHGAENVGPSGNRPNSPSQVGPTGKTLRL